MRFPERFSGKLASLLHADTNVTDSRSIRDFRRVQSLIMTPLREWLKPPRKLLLILFLLTLVSVSALAWFGWRLLDQERMVEAQRTQERLEHAADRLSAT